jgi:outer membrane protein TolC
MTSHERHQRNREELAKARRHVALARAMLERVTARRLAGLVSAEEFARALAIFEQTQGKLSAMSIALRTEATRRVPA